MIYNTLTQSNYYDLRKRILAVFEGENWYPYLDGKFIATIGVGVNIEQSQFHLSVVLQEIGFVLSDNPKSTDTDYSYFNQIWDKLKLSNSNTGAQPNQKVDNIADINAIFQVRYFGYGDSAFN